MDFFTQAVSVIQTILILIGAGLGIWGVVTLAWMYLTPIFYDLDILSPQVRYWMPRLNPLYMYIRQVRDFILVGSWERYLLTIRGAFMAVLMLAIGVFVFNKTKDNFILYI